jgi:hypothetical protein
MSFCEEIRRAVMVSPRVKLPELSSILWKAFAAGQVSEEEASQLSDLIEARKAIPALEKPVQRRVGSRPRSPASMERRRSWAAAGRLPPRIAASFTLAEQAVLAVVAVEVSKRGDCGLTVAHLAALAGVSESTVRNALREAEALGLIGIDRRRRTAWMNHPNRVSILSKEWALWLRLGTGAKSCGPRIQKNNNGLALTRKNINSSRISRKPRDQLEPKEVIQQRQGAGLPENRSNHA